MRSKYIMKCMADQSSKGMKKELDRLDEYSSRQ